jgi:outer membrane receptor protein involved in Fe transport
MPRTGALAASIGALLATGGLSSTAWGQDQETTSSSQQDTIIVTGTRIRRDDFSAAQATTVVTGDDMRALGVVSVADMVNQLPNNIATVSPEATADSPFFLGASIANMRGLNTGYGVRTLTLLDSRRMTPTNNGGGVDMNFIPSALVGRIETVTGGASATYGADAMAGVVNVILDDNIENIRVDLNYQTSAEGDGDQYTFSLGTGFQFFENNRGNLTVGLDMSRQEAIEDCMTRSFCQRGLGLVQNGSYNGSAEYQPRSDIFLEGQPEWVPMERHRFSTNDLGVAEDDGYADPGNFLGYDVNGDPMFSGDLTQGWYTFNEAGTDMIPYYVAPGMSNNPLSIELTPEQLAAIESVGTQTFGSTFGSTTWATPYGGGRPIYSDVPIIPETNRDNLFLRFTYELEGGIELGADLTYGETTSTSLQNSSKGNLQNFCVSPANAYMQGPAQGGNAGDLMRAVYNARSRSGAQGDLPIAILDFSAFSGACLQAPFLGGSFQPRADDITSPRYDFPGGLEFSKDYSEQVDRVNTNDSNAMALTLTANGTLFDGGSWTWDAYAQFGHTENRQTLSGWRAARRWDMALDSVLEDTDNDGVGDTPVCGIDAQNAYFTILDDDGVMREVNYGDDLREKWASYLNPANADNTTPAERQAIFDGLAEGCVPFNPFGNQPFTQEQLDYIFPTLFEGTDNDQTGLSFSFSGDAWKGIGNAGPMRMAAGLDWRENDTQNIADSNRYLGADFNYVGNSSGGQIDRIYGDNWWGRTTTKEAWVEFDLPLLRDKVGAQSLSFNTSFRRSENTTLRISGVEEVQAPSDTRSVDSWKASMQWAPVDIMRVRMTRSADVRAPSARELYATNSYATESGGQTEVYNNWRFGIDFDAGGGFQAWTNPEGFKTDIGDQIIRIQGGNAQLDSEVSTTDTLGLVFQPVDAVPGLQVSVDYYQTTIKGGIRRLTVNNTISACEDEVGRWWEGDQVPKVPINEMQFCTQIQFDDFPRDPNDPQAFYTDGAFFGFNEADLIIDPATGEPVAAGTPNPYHYIEGLGSLTNIITVAESTINEEPFVSRGIDYSVSYFTQLDGGGSINARALFTRFLEQSVFLRNTFGTTDVSGQTGSRNLEGGFSGFGTTNYSPTPRIRGNLFLTYNKNAFTMTAQAIYTGAGKLNVESGWLGPNDGTYYTRYSNGFIDVAGPVNQYVGYDPNLDRTVYSNDLPSWTTLNMNFSYDFGRSRFQLDRFESLSAYLNIENIGDRIPTFISGTGAGGLNTSLFSGMGRSYRMGVRMEF